MKILLSLLLPALFTSGAVAAPIIAAEKVEANTTFLSGQTHENARRPDFVPRLLEEDEDEQESSTEEKTENTNRLKTGIYVALIEVQANLDSLLSLDVTDFTEEELLAHNKEIEELQNSLIKLGENLTFIEKRLQLLEGKLVREDFRTKQAAHLAVVEYRGVSLEEDFEENVLRFIGRAEGINRGEFYRLRASVKSLDLRISAIESQLTALYEVDITNLTEEQLIAHNEKISELEARAVELNDRLITVNENYSELEQATSSREVNPQDKINEKANEMRSEVATRMLQERFGVFVDKQ